MTKNVTFWSYKGGVGRTIALVNTAFQLARQGEKVLIWEMDLEAPGLLQIPIFHELGKTVKGGMVDILSRASERLDTVGSDVERYVVRYQDTKYPRISFDVLAAGAPNGEYFRKYTSLNWGKFFGPDTSLGYFVFEAIQRTLARTYGPDFVLIDSRTGVTDLSAVCTVQLPDTVVMVFNLSHQGVEGTVSVKRAIEQSSRDRRRPGAPIQPILVASMVPAGSTELVQRRVEELRGRGLESPILVQLQEDLLVEELVVSRDADTSGNYRKFEELANRLRDSKSDDPTKYFEWLAETCGWIELRGLQIGSGKAHRFPIEDLYIPLKMEARRTDGDHISRPADQDLEAALSSPRLVIEGSPGSGKSTFLRQLARKLPGFPILIRVADLDEHIRTCADRSDSGGPTTQESPAWISHYLESKGWGLDRSFFERRLKHPDTTLLLDGLDEASDGLRRKSIARLLEEATRLYPKCRFVVTTRPQAYTGGSVLAGFERAWILDLDDEAVDLFLGRWSRCLFPESAASVERHSGELRAALGARPEIRSMARNPVMLTALAVVHWNESRLPEQRADLYESIVVWLARARDQREGRQKADICLQWLGWLALEMQLVKGGRVAQAGRGRAAELLAGRLGGPQNVGAKLDVARKFLDEEEVDSGIIVGAGDSYKFWHLTFQEYLAARALAGRPDSDIHATVLDDARLYKPEWRETMTLLGGVLKRQGGEKVDALFDKILEGATAKPLAHRVRCAALLAAMARDLEPTGYKPSNPAYATVRASMAELFDPGNGVIGLRERVEAAEALGVDHPRLRLPSDNDYWISIPAGRGTQPFRIGRHPVTVFEYAQFVNAGGPEPWVKWEEQQSHPSRPVVGVDWNQAKAYCQWASARMLTDAEWSRAAYGDGRPFPWGGEEPRPELANYKDTGIGAPTPVGLFPNGNTPEGVADMVGNVWEWVEDWSEGGEGRIIRGTAHYSDDLRAPVRGSASPVKFLDGGLRCARDWPA